MFKDIFEKKRREYETNGLRLNLHEMIEEIDSRQLAGFLEIMKEILPWLNSQKADPIEKDILGREQVWHDQCIAELFRLLTTKKITPNYLRDWLHQRSMALRAANNFPEPFGGAPLVVGALHLAIRLGNRIRCGGEDDLSMLQYRWVAKLLSNSNAEGTAVYLTIALLMLLYVEYYGYPLKIWKDLRRIMEQ